MGALIYDKNEIIEDYLNHNFTQTELAHFYDTKYHKGYISSQTISKILNNKNLPNDIKRKISLKKEEIKRNNKNSNETNEEIIKRIDLDLPKIVLLKSFINELNIKKLRAVYLFINGYNYTYISHLLGIARGTVSNYINEIYNNNYLNDVSYLLLEKRMKETSKYNTKVKDELYKVIKTFVENNGNYQKTMELTHISNRTLSRYFSLPNLKDLLKDDSLYNQFILLVDRYNKQRSMLANAASLRQKKLKNSLNKATTVKENRLKKILEFILLENITDIDVLSEKVNLSKELICDILKNSEDDIKNIFGFFVYKEYEMKKNLLIHQKYEKEISIISSYLRSRYSYDELATHYFTNRMYLDKILNNPNNYLTNIWGSNLETIIQEHTEEIIRIRKACPKDMVVVNIPEMIAIVKPNILYVTREDYKLLNNIINYYTFNDRKNSAYILNYLLVNFKSNHLKDLLSTEAYQQLQLYLKYEELLNLPEKLNDKMKLFREVINSFYDNGLDIDLTLEKLKMPFEIFERIIYYDGLNSLYIPEVLKVIKLKSEEYKKLKKQEQDYHLLTNIKDYKRY